MPCRDYSDAEIASQYAERADHLARMLCGVMTWLDQDPDTHDLLWLYQKVPGLNAWWIEHKRKDAERIRQEEKARKQRVIERKLARYKRKLEAEG